MFQLTKGASAAHGRVKPWFERVGYFTAFALMVAVFQGNILHTTSEFQFRTYRDGSEALVLGKVFADRKGVPTPNGHMGFIEKETATRQNNVLAVYEYLDLSGYLTPLPLTDQNWRNGYSNWENAFLLSVANVAKIGFASNEVVPGQAIIFANDQRRTVTKVSREGDILTVMYDGSRVNPEDQSKKGMKLDEHRPFVFSPYPKQFGIQAITMSWLYRHVAAFRSVFALQMLASVLLALVLTFLIREFALSISPSFAIVFFVTMIGSPWIVAVARNLYWVSFLWFLPALCAMRTYRSATASARYAWIVCFGLAVFIKCLAGYEYISTILIFAMTAFVVDPFKGRASFKPKSLVVTVSAMVGMAIIAFAAAVLIHSSYRAESLPAGIYQTLHTDAFKYSNMVQLGLIPEHTTVKFVVLEYLTHWTTPLVFFLGGHGVFQILIGLSIAILVMQFYARQADARRDAALLVATAMAPLSWYVLLPLHSAIHVHLNYVLWYFGFIPAVVFVILRGARTLLTSRL